MMTGLLSGFVAENRDPKHLGRVRVSFCLPGAGRERSEWARVALPFASKDGGFHFIPGVGDEVVLAFPDGDPSQPVVLGSVYNEDRPPPEADSPSKHNRDGKNSLRAIKTTTGMEISFSEDPGNACVRIADGSGLTVELNRTKKEIRIGDESGNVVRIQNGMVEIEAKSKITLGAGGSQPVPLGNALMQLFNSHSHNTAMGPSSPPTQPMTPQQLSRLTYTK
jgi:uncharacterized protein involved in type VI secretion and phage assembly